MVFSVSAGFPDRDVPAHLVELAVAHLLLPVLVGRHYPRFGRREQRVRHRGVPVCSTYPGRRGGAPVVRLRLLSHRDQHAGLAALSAIGLRPAHLAPRLLASGINFEESWHARFDSRDLLPTAEGSFEIFNREGEPK